MEPKKVTKENVLTKSDVLKIMAKLEEAIETNTDAQAAIADTDFRRGKIHAYKYALSIVEAQARWKEVI